MTDQEISELEALLRAAYQEAEQQVDRLEKQKAGFPADSIEAAECDPDDFARRLALILMGRP